MVLQTICAWIIGTLHFTMGLARGMPWLGADQRCETGFHHHHFEMNK